VRVGLWIRAFAEFGAFFLSYFGVVINSDICARREQRLGWVNTSSVVFLARSLVSYMRVTLCAGISCYLNNSAGTGDRNRPRNFILRSRLYAIGL
jgi:hypothetical protein